MKIELNRTELIAIRNTISHYTLKVEATEELFNEWDRKTHFCKFGSFRISENDSLTIDIPQEVMLDIIRTSDHIIRPRQDVIKADLKRAIKSISNTRDLIKSEIDKIFKKYRAKYEYDVFISEDQYGKDVIYIIRIDIDHIRNPKIIRKFLASGASWSSDQYPEKYNDTAVIVGSFDELSTANEFMDFVVAHRPERDEDGMRVWNAKRIRDYAFKEYGTHEKLLVKKSVEVTESFE